MQHIWDTICNIFMLYLKHEMHLCLIACELYMMINMIRVLLIS
jgi:hypothetical protein